MKKQLLYFRNSLFGSYSQVFFSDNTTFGVFLLLASFVDPCVGFSGLISVVFAVFLAKGFGLNPEFRHNGTYTYNSLLTGFALGAYFQFGILLFVVLLFSSLLTLLLSVWLASITSRHKLPFLSLPFILGIWIVLLNTRSFNVNVAVRTAHSCFPFWLDSFNSLSSTFEKASLPHLVITYFKSMSSIFFQGNFISGIIISAGLLVFSRIAFSLSILGFLSGFVYFNYFHGNSLVSDYSYTSFNYILSAIALGGFYLVSSTRSFLLTLLLTPVVGLFISALGMIIAPLFLPLYSLPFTLAVIIIVSALNNRYSYKHLNPVYYQHYSPEKNLYTFHNFNERFKNNTYINIHLPFFGEWLVSQGHEGDITHKSKYKYAWDFVVTDEEKRTFKYPGKECSDFYCYGLPVLAPADGTVINLEDGIEDNKIGDVNLAENWGNTIILKHSEYLYSKLSHIKKGSFKVKTGDQVKKGEVLAACGNSGRSPEPHIHFQLQSTPYLGADTLNYPISYYLVRKNSLHLNSFNVPKQGETLIRPTNSPVLKQAFHFIPGMKFKFDVNDGKKNYTDEWEVLTDPENNSYFKCERSGSIAYFNSNDIVFYFTSFKGDKTSLLYYFYLAAYKVFLNDSQDIQMEDTLPVESVYSPLQRSLQDFIAPFFIFIKPKYSGSVRYRETKNVLLLISKASLTESERNAIHFEMELSGKTIIKFVIKKQEVCITATQI